MLLLPTLPPLLLLWRSRLAGAVLVFLSSFFVGPYMPISSYKESPSKGPRPKPVPALLLEAGPADAPAVMGEDRITHREEGELSGTKFFVLGYYVVC